MLFSYIYVRPSDIRRAYLVYIFDTTDEERETLVFGEGDSGLIHDAEPFGEGFVDGYLFVTLRIWVFCWILIIDSVDFGSLYHVITVQFERSKHGSRIGREVRIPGPSHRDDDTPLSQVLQGTFVDESLCDLRNLDGRHDAYGLSCLFNGISESHSIDDGREHPHVIASSSVYPLRGT